MSNFSTLSPCTLQIIALFENKLVSELTKIVGLKIDFYLKKDTAWFWRC